VNIEYLYVPLEGATLISRKHVRDVKPPGMTLLKNAFLSRSDSSITIRPDFDDIAEDIYAVSSALIPVTANLGKVEYLNRVMGVQGSDDVIWFTTKIPYGPIDGTLTWMSDSYSDGTISGTAGSTTITGSSTAFLANVWRGCIMEFNGDGKYYVVSKVNSDTSLELTVPLADAYAADTYESFYVHSPYRSNYRLNVQQYTSGIIYCSPSIGAMSAEDICGPFYASASESDWNYSFVDVDVTYFDYFDDVNVTDFTHQDSQLAANGNAQIGYKTSIGEYYYNPNSFVKIDETGVATNIGPPAADIYQYTKSVFYNPENDRAYYAGKSSTEHVGFTANSDPLSDYAGPPWSTITKLIPTRSYPTYEGQSIAVKGNEDRIVLLVRTAADDTIEAYYSDDNGDNWSLADSFTGSLDTKIRYINSNFVIVDPDGDQIRYGDGSGAFTTDAALTGNMDICWTGTNYVVVGGNGKTAYTPDFLTAWTAVDTGCTEAFNHVTYDEQAKNVLVVTTNYLWRSDDDGATWTSQDISKQIDTSSFGEPSNIAISGDLLFYAPNSSSVEAVKIQRDYTTTWTMGKFTPLSTAYRATTFSCLDGYVVLFGTRELSGSTWTYYPRRARWTVPATYNNFTGSGAGVADLRGSGAILDSVPVNGRILLIETSTLGALVPRGITSDPWDYGRN